MYYSNTKEMFNNKTEFQELSILEFAQVLKKLHIYIVCKNYSIVNQIYKFPKKNIKI